VPLDEKRIIKGKITVTCHEPHVRNNNSNIYKGKNMYVYAGSERFRIVEPDQVICVFTFDTIKDVRIESINEESFENQSECSPNNCDG
jgi:hypothetical protein